MKGLKNLNAKTRRNIIVYGAIAAFLLAAIGVSRNGSLNNTPPVNAENLLGSADSHAMGIASIDKETAQNSNDIGQIKEQMSRLEKGEASAANSSANQGANGQSPVGATTGVPQPAATPTLGTPIQAPTSAPPPPVPTYGNGRVNMPQGGYGSPGYQPNGMPNATDGTDESAPPTINTYGSDDDDTSKKQDGFGSHQSQAGRVVETSASTSSDDSDASKDKAQTPKVYIPAGTMLTGVLLTGVDAPTGREASSHPIPLLVRIKQEAILPNEYQADYSECFIVASAMGDLSSERAYIRGETLSCVATNGGVIQAHIEMWGSGEDGKAGMRGTLVSKQGSILAKAMLAGFASGISKAFQPTQGLTITSSGSPYSTVPLGTAGRTAAMGGVSSAADQIASFYLQLADSEFPVIEISAGRPVTFIVESGAQLSTLEKKS